VTGRSFVSPATRSRVRGLALPVALALGRLGLTPNSLTIAGFIGTCAAAVAAGYQQWALAGILVLGFGIFDLFDGSLARATGRASKFGAFLDSTLDRTGENLVLAGVAVGAANARFTEGVLLAVLAMAFASVVTYARAKAEVVGLHGEVGVAPRSERIVILAAGLIAAGLAGGVYPQSIVDACKVIPDAACDLPRDDMTWSIGGIALSTSLFLIAALSAITVIQRILHVKQQLDQQENP
jgi:CDP-diacylglycerol---glycerol-3-phosphate 3-phosphatidyltransferase